MKYKRWVVAVSTAACLSLGTYGWVAHANEIREGQYYKVDRVLDGDTFDIKVGFRKITVRMLGIDTPETVDPRKPEQCYGHEASDETKSLLVGHTVRLEFNPNRERLDKYRRYLAYVYRDDGIFLNEFLLKEGFAREYTFGKPYLKQKEFRGLEKAARAAKSGLWGVCGDYKPKADRSS